MSHSIQIKKTDNIQNASQLWEQCQLGQRARNLHGANLTEKIRERFKEIGAGNLGDQIFNKLNYGEKKLLLDVFEGKNVNLIDLYELKEKIYIVSDPRVPTVPPFQERNNLPMNKIAEIINSFIKFINFGTKTDKAINDSILNASEEKSFKEKLKERDLKLERANIKPNEISDENQNEKPQNPGPIKRYYATKTNVFDHHEFDVIIIAGNPDIHTARASGLMKGATKLLKKTPDQMGWKAFQQEIRNFVNKKVNEENPELIDLRQSRLNDLIDPAKTPELNPNEYLNFPTFLPENKQQQMVVVAPPRYPGDYADNRNTATEQLKESYLASLAASLEVAKRSPKEEITVSIPLLGAGQYGWPTHLSARIAFEAIDQFNAQNQNERVKINCVICELDPTKSKILKNVIDSRANHNISNNIPKYTFDEEFVGSASDEEFADPEEEFIHYDV